MHRVYDNLHQSMYGYVDPKPVSLLRLNLKSPKTCQHILRMPVSIDGGEHTYLPDELKWLSVLILIARGQQKRHVKSGNPFVYVTVRHGFVESKDDDLWHVDGFSTRVAHRPEQNYIWCDHTPTEWWDENIHIPDNFDPHIHNIQYFFQDTISNKTHAIKQMKEKVIYRIDPYIIHRRPPNTFGIYRTFVRVSFIAIPILDVQNTYNPLLPMMGTHDGISRRNNLQRYSVELS